MGEYIKDSYISKIRELNDIIHQKEAECEELRDKFVGLVEHSPLPMLITVNRKIQYSNKAMQLKFGYTRTELLNAGTRMLYDEEAEYDRIGKLIDEHDEFITPTVLCRKDGTCAPYTMKFTKHKKENYVSLYLTEV